MQYHVLFPSYAACLETVCLAFNSQSKIVLGFHLGVTLRCFWFLVASVFGFSIYPGTGRRNDMSCCHHDSRCSYFHLHDTENSIPSRTLVSPMIHDFLYPINFYLIPNERNLNFHPNIVPMTFIYRLAVRF